MSKRELKKEESIKDKKVEEALEKNKKTTKKVKDKKKLFEPIEEVDESNKKKKNTFFKVFMIILIILCVGVIGGFCYYYLILPSIKLNGSKSIVVEYETPYEEKGYIAKHFGKDITSKVKVKDNINPKKIGNYEVVYSVANNGLSKKVIRNVAIVDTKKPKMSIDSSDVYVCPGDEYIKEQVTATDNYDGDISKNVNVDISKEKDKVVYSVKDSSGNTSSVTKKILYEDKKIMYLF